MKAIRLTFFGFLLLVAAAGAAVAAEGDTAAAGKDAYKQLPLRRDTEDHGLGWGVLALLGVIGVAAVLVSARVRKTGRAWPVAGLASVGWPKAAAQRVEVLERRNLNTACTVVLVRWDDEEVLLGCTAQSVALIARRPAGAPMPEQA